MTGLVLGLNPDCLQSPTRLDLSVLENMMLWPDDAAARERALRTAGIESVFPYRANMTAAELSEVLEVSREAQPIAEIQKLVPERFVRGVISGSILREALGHLVMGTPITMAQAINLAIKPSFFNKKPEWKFRPQTINNDVWPKFHSVSHFWAATLDRQSNRQDQVFPCARRNLVEFLATAEAYRRLGESSRLSPKSPKPVLSRDIMVRLPAVMEQNLPPLALSFSRAKR